MRVKTVLAWNEDIGEKCIRLPGMVRTAIGVELGDKVLAKGPRGSAVLIAVIADRTEIGKKVAGIDAQTRRLLGVELGSSISVSKPSISVSRDPSTKPRTPIRRPRASQSPSRRAPTQWLFSYGSNNPEQLEERLGHPAIDARAAYLRHYQLCFLGYSYNRDGGVAGLLKNRNAEACGYVSQVTELDLDIMDRYEGVSGGYYYRDMLAVMIETDNGDFEEVDAVVYLPGPQRLNVYPHHPPGDEYLDAVEKTIFTFWDEGGECRGYLNQALAKVARSRHRNPDPTLWEYQSRRSGKLRRWNPRYGPLSEENPELAAEWDFEKNGPLTPDDVSPGSGKKVWWKCWAGHSWPAMIANRARKGVGCPTCAGKLSQTLAEANPELVEEWSFERNHPLTPDDVSPGSGKKVWWGCPKGHSWNAAINRRARAGTGCPTCAGYLHQTLSEATPELISEWDFEKNHLIDPNDAPIGSTKKVWWECPIGHSWEASISSRARLGTGCPFCAGRLHQTLAEANLELVAEWDFEKNNPLTPDDVSPGSTKKVWWKCLAGHVWQAIINNRARKNGNNCPTCAGHLHQTLAETNPELIDEWDFEKNNPLTPDDVSPGTNKKVWWKCRTGHSWQARISGRARRGIGCPTCAGYLHQTLAETNPELISEWDFEKNSPLTPDDVSPGSSKKVWWKCQIGHNSWEATINKRARKDNGCPICAGQLHQTLAEANPELVDEWDFEKNNPLTPDDVSPGSNKKVWWKCYAEHSWKASIGSRARNGHNCPRCAGRLHQTLAGANPELISEWDFEKNHPLTPDDVSPGTNKKVWWKCRGGHSWESRIGSRARNDVGCPECYLTSVRRDRKPRRFDGTGRKGSSGKSPRRSTRGGSQWDIGPRRPRHFGRLRRNPEPAGHARPGSEARKRFSGLWEAFDRGISVEELFLERRVRFLEKLKAEGTLSEKGEKALERRRAALRTVQDNMRLHRHTMSRLTDKQEEVLGEYVIGREVYDLGAGDCGFAASIRDYFGADRVVAVDKERLACPEGVESRQMRFEQLLDEVDSIDVSFVSWPINRNIPALNELVQLSEIVIYLGSNCNGSACAGPRFFQTLVPREVLAYIPSRQSTLIVYGPGPRTERKIYGEEFAALTIYEQERALSTDEAEAQSAVAN